MQISFKRNDWVFHTARGVFSANGPDSSFGGGAGYDCFGDDLMEEEVQVRVQVEVGREEHGEGETHGKE